jgi:hypothetical protein
MGEGRSLAGVKKIWNFGLFVCNNKENVKFYNTNTTRAQHPLT